MHGVKITFAGPIKQRDANILLLLVWSPPFWGLPFLGPFPSGALALTAQPLRGFTKPREPRGPPPADMVPAPAALVVARNEGRRSRDQSGKLRNDFDRVQ